MDSHLTLPRIDPAEELPYILRLLIIIKTWFWRYFDHFFHLVFYNFCWSVSCFGIWWLLLSTKNGLVSNRGDYLYAVLIYILENIISIGWAYLVFKIFIDGSGSINDVWKGIKKYFFKAIGISLVSGLFVGIGLFNVQFYFHLNKPHHFTDYLIIGFIFWILFFWILSSLYHWPIIFFQNPPFLKVIYKSFILVLGNWFVSSMILIIYSVCILLFSLVWPLWFFLGLVFLFSLQCVALEKHLIKYKITYDNKPFEALLEKFNYEQTRGWREFLKPWENK